MLFTKLRLPARFPLVGFAVEPLLVHGDLWYAHAGIDVGSGESLIFDACSFYGHNERKSKCPE